MFLNFWDSVRNYLQKNINLGNILTLIIGIFVGLLIAGLIYVVLIIKSTKNAEKKSIEKYKKIDSDDEQLKLQEEQVKEYIENSVSRYDDVCKGKDSGEKITEAKEIIMTMVVDIAKVYYPESKHPLAELTVEEVIMLDRYIVDRIESIFDKKLICLLKKRKIVTALNLLDIKKEAEETKLIKAAKKYHVTTIASALSRVINAVNPVYWTKQGIVNPGISFSINYFIRAIIRIVGNETANIYSKNAFNANDNDVEQEIINATNGSGDDIIEIEEEK